MASQADPHDYLERKAGSEGDGRSGESGTSVEVRQSNSTPHLVVASFCAQRKEKPGGIVTARVLFDGTHSISVNTRIRVRDQERFPIAADITKILRRLHMHSLPMSQKLVDRSQYKEGTGTCSVRKSAFEGQCVCSTPLAASGWHPPPISGRGSDQRWVG